MNKKIFGLFLVVAALLSAASFQSCKDNDSDLYNEVLIKDTQHYNELKNRIDAIESSLGNVDCEALKSDVEALKTEVEALKSKLGDYSVDKLNDVIARVEALEAQNKEILAAFESLQSNYEKLLARLEAIEESLSKVDSEALKSQVDALKAEVEALKSKLGDFSMDKLDDAIARVEALEAQNTEILAAFEALQFNYEELLARVEAIEASLSREDCAALKAELEALKATVAAANLGRINELLSRVLALESKMKLNGVTVQSVYTPAFGSFNSPVGLNSNILLGYCGNIVNREPGFFESGVSFTGNLGTIYLTVDPLNVSFANNNKVAVALRSSTGTPAGITMSPLEEANKDIILGYTRAGANKYLYQTTATLKDVDAVQHITLNTQAYKDALKDIISYKDGINLSNIASLIYNTVNTDLRANAVEVSYEGESVISKYEICAAVVKPLGFATFDVLGSINGNAVASKVSSAANKIVNKVQSVLVGKFGANLINFEIGSITLVPATGGITVTIPKDKIEFKVTVNGTDETVKNDKPIDFTIKYSELGGAFADAQGKIDNMIYMVNNYISKINSAWTTITTGSGSALINNAVEVIVNKTISVAERASHLAYPTLFVVDGNKLKRLSTIAAAPTFLDNSSVELIPSSSSLELVVPFYKKQLSANGNVTINDTNINNDVITLDGTTLRAKMTVPSGVTTIEYAVADYYGNIETFTCYVKK